MILRRLCAVLLLFLLCDVSLANGWKKVDDFSGYKVGDRAKAPWVRGNPDGKPISLFRGNYGTLRMTWGSKEVDTMGLMRPIPTLPSDYVTYYFELTFTGPNLAHNIFFYDHENPRERMDHAIRLHFINKSGEVEMTASSGEEQVRVVSGLKLEQTYQVRLAVNQRDGKYTIFFNDGRRQAREDDKIAATMNLKGFDKTRKLKTIGLHCYGKRIKTDYQMGINHIYVGGGVKLALPSGL